MDRSRESPPESQVNGSMDKMRFLAEAARDLNSSLELEVVFQKIARRVYDLVDSHLFCVMLWNEAEQVLDHSYSLRFGEHVELEGSVALGYGVSGAAAELGRAIRVANVNEDPRYVRFRHAEVDIRSELAVPLLCQERLVGVLDLESMEPDLFTEEHEQMLSALAHQMATALENARLYEAMVAQERRLEQDLATARQIQRGLLPEEPPLLPGFDLGTGFAPARELAGDFFDFLPYVDGRVAFVVGDVAGKSTGAALYGALSVGIMRGHVVEHSFSPAQMLCHMNEHLCLLRCDNRFLAMAYGLLDPATRSLTLGTAAFPHPRFVRDGRLENVATGGLPLGLFPDAEYEDTRVDLQPGDVLVLCSDGLEDCLLEMGEKVPERAMDEWVGQLATRSAQEIADELIRVSQPAAESKTEAADDRTVLVVKVVGDQA